MKNKLLLIPIFLIFTISFYGQITVKGVVLDKNKNPLPFVNVVLKHTKIGTTTDTNGVFKITCPKNKGRLVFSYLGFTSYTKKITKKTKYLTVVLQEDANELDEVVIVTKPKKRLKKKENPAYRILKQIWKNKKKNGVKIADFYQYEKLETVEIGLTNLDTVFLQKIFKKDFENIKEKLPLDENGSARCIPLYIKETVSKIYGNNKANITRIDVEAEKSKGIHDNGFVFDKMGNTFNRIDIYKNNVQVLKKAFVSPISTTGFETYDYVLHDSTTVNQRKLYHIYFFPRRNGDLAFQGDFWVADKIYAITKIKMKVHKDINLNFVKRLYFEKEFFIQNDSMYLPKKNRYQGDFTYSDDIDMGMSIKKTHVFSNYVFEKPKKDDFYTTTIEKYKPKQYQKSKEYWKKIDEDNITKKETYQLIGELKEKSKIKQITGVLNTLSTGYITIKSPIQIGQYWNTFIKNSVEGLKIKLGFRTFIDDEDRFRASSFVAYGTKDKRYKFGFETKYLISYKPRIAFGVAYLYDVEQLGSKLLNTNSLNENVFDPNALFSRGKNYFLSFVNKKVLKFDIALHKNLHLGISGAHNFIKSADPSRFSMDYLNDANQIKSTVTDVSTDIYFSYTPGRFVYGLGVEQRIGNNLYPSFVFNYHKGYKVFGGDFSYDKIQFNYSHPILLGKIGLLRASVDAGKTFGKVPIALLSPIPANQTFWLTRNTFSLMNYYDFVTDTYISGQFEHHFNGLIFNKIPLIKKLKLRSVFTFKTVYGTISDKNIAINRSNIRYTAPSNKLYNEFGFGIENIGYKEVRPIRIDYVWRGKHTSVNGLPSPKHAIRIGIRAGF